MFLKENRTKYITKIFEIKDNFHIVNSYGSIRCDYFDIGLGKWNFAILSRLYPWDHIPGVFIVRIAGGHDCHFDKLEYKFYKIAFLGILGPTSF